MAHNLFQRHHHRVRSVLLPRVVELPAMIVFIVEYVNDIFAVLHHVGGGENRTILRLIKWPGAHMARLTQRSATGTTRR